MLSATDVSAGNGSTDRQHASSCRAASFSLPKATSGSDMIMSLLLVDPTSPDPNHGTGQSGRQKAAQAAAAGLPAR